MVPHLGGYNQPMYWSILDQANTQNMLIITIRIEDSVITRY